MKRVIFMAFLLLFATSISTMAVEMAVVGGPTPDVPSFVGYAPNRIVVKFDPPTLQGIDKATMARGRTGLPALDQVGTLYGVRSLRPQFPGAKKKSYKGKVIDLSGWHEVEFADRADVLSAVEHYKAVPGVLDAQPVGIHKVNVEPNDWNYIHSPYQWHLPRIQAPQAWDIETGNPGIIVAVMDTGVRYFHRDLGGANASFSDPAAAEGNMWINTVERGATKGVDEDGNRYVDDWIGWDFVHVLDNWPTMQCFPGEDCLEPDNDPRDFHGHGTHCAGNVATMNNNSYSQASVAGGWGNGNFVGGPGSGVRVMDLRIGWRAIYGILFDVGMVDMGFAAQALQYAADKGARIASCSWGSDNSGGIVDAIQYFVATSEERPYGGLIFKAAGNDSTETADFLCARDDVLCVAATDQNDCKASFSTYGTWVDISAPGVGIWSSWHNPDDQVPDYIATMDGTSMATPLAASVAALIWSQNPGWSADNVIQRLFESADSIDGLSCNSSFQTKLGAGRINAYRAVLSTVPSPPPACTDADNDGFSVETGCGPATDCNDNDSSIHPGATDVCGDGIDQDCSGSDSICPNPNDVDNDVDGYTENQGDCNDSDPAIHPGATENCGDSMDNDCDELIDISDPDCSTPPPGCTDNDGDGYYPEGGVCGAVDCNDNESYIHPGAYDYCNNGIDEDCDGSDRTTGWGCKNGGGNGGAKEICDNGSDDDGDGKIDCADKKDCGKDPACQ